MLVDIVIPVYGNWDVTERCLNALAPREACVHRIIVVDDASPDGSGERLGARSDVQTLLLPRNGGFSAACNAGAALAQSEAILFLNNDTIVKPGAIGTLLGALERDASIGAVGAKLTYADGTIQSAGCVFLNRLETWQLYRHLRADLPQADRAGDYAFLTGAALMIRTALFHACGGFDVGYRNGVEDVDLCMSVWKRGYRVHYEPRAQIAHLEGLSRGKHENQAANWRRFAERWTQSDLAHLPRFEVTQAPHMLIDWKAAAPIDALVYRHLRSTFRQHGSVRLTSARAPGAGIVESMRARVERRGVIRIGYRSKGAADARWFSGGERLDIPSGPIWVPSSKLRDALIASGVEDARIEIVRIGHMPVQSAHEGAATVIVTDRSVPEARIDAIRRALLPSRPLLFDLEHFDESHVRTLRSAPRVIFACDGDSWGYLGRCCLSAGACVVAPKGAPFLEALPDDIAITASYEHLPEAAHVLMGPNAREIGAAARRELLTYLPAALTAERITELGRAFIGGIPDPARYEITALP